MRFSDTARIHVECRFLVDKVLAMIADSGKTEEIETKSRGAMTPFTREQLHLIGASLKAAAATRDLALLCTGVDTLLRCGDLVRLRVRDVTTHTGDIRLNLDVTQDKTDQPVTVHLTPQTRQSLTALIKETEKFAGDYLFTREGANHGQHLSEVMLRRLVKDWARIARLDPKEYSGHSLRRSKAAFIYEETQNVEVCRQMLGHASLAQTMKYLGVDKKKVADVAMKYDIWAR